MSRIGDVGDYTKDNVFIQLGSDNVSQAHVGKKHSEEWKQNMSASLKGKPPNSIGSKRTEVSKSAMSATMRAKPDVTCPHCGKVGYNAVMHRWHFDNCKHQ